jgi:hypothetical protein
MPETAPGAMSGQHEWAAAAIIGLDDAQAKRAVLRHSVWLSSCDPDGQPVRIDVLETYCRLCRRPWDDVADEPCIAATTTEHLRGGPIGQRKKRKHDHRCDLLGCDVPGSEQRTG